MRYARYKNKFSEHEDIVLMWHKGTEHGYHYFELGLSNMEEVKKKKIRMPLSSK
jgi:hypothetical protein